MGVAQEVGGRKDHRVINYKTNLRPSWIKSLEVHGDIYKPHGPF